MKFTKILLFAGLLAVTAACSSDDLSSTSVITATSNVDNTDFGKWLQKNYTEPFNIDFQYRYNDKLTDHSYNVIPADTAKSRAMAILLKHVWLDAYREVAGEDFLKKHCFRQIQLIGSPEYSSQGSIVLGTAEGGIQVTLFRINNLDPTNIYINQDDPYENKSQIPLDLNYWYFHTMHHEFCHILTQTINYSTDFQTVSQGKYTSSDWVNIDDKKAATMGFVTGYASGEYNEDFAELYSTYVTHTPEAWQKILDQGTVVQLDDNGDTLYTYTKDSKGNKILATDAKGFLVPSKDASGATNYEKDKTGKYVYFKDASGNKIPVYDGQASLVYILNRSSIIPAYLGSDGKYYNVTKVAGNPVYEKDENGNTVYDASGAPVQAYYKVPVFEYKKTPTMDTTGRDAILKKLEILRSYFKDSWKIDLDKMREVVLRRSKNATTLDLTNLPE